MKILVGTYREVNRKWIEDQRLYNLPVPEGCDPSLYKNIDAVVLYRGDNAALAYRVGYVGAVDACRLKECGYITSSEPHGSSYALFTLMMPLKVEEVLSSRENDLWVCSSRYTGVIDSSFYERPLPYTGGASIPNIFEKLRPFQESGGPHLRPIPFKRLFLSN